MKSQTITSAIKSGKILVSDGALGTIMQERGLKPGECPELWNLNRPLGVQDIACGYYNSRADMLTTNSFGATSFKLAHYGLADRVSEINEAAAQLIREIAGDRRWVLGSVGPTGKMLLMGDVTEEEIYEAYKTQVIALEKGGADAICIETMSDIDEAVLAIRAAKENTALEVICTFTFNPVGENEFRTMMGVSPAEAAVACLAAGADIIGTNCGNGMKNMISIVAQMREAAPDTPIMIQANAGLPEVVDGKIVYPETPGQMKALVPQIIAAGANIIGGCCGTNPEHIYQIHQAVNACTPL